MNTRRRLVGSQIVTLVNARAMKWFGTIDAPARGRNHQSEEWQVRPVVGFLAAMAMAIGLSAGVRGQGCTFTLSRTTVLAGPEAVVGSSTLTASAPGCAWTAVSSEPWLLASWSMFGGGGGQGSTTVSGTGSSTLSFLVQANPSGVSRTATISVGGLTFSVTQQATPCVTSLTPSSISFPFPGFGDPADQRKDVVVDAPADCHWSPFPWPASVSPGPPPIGNVGPGIVRGVGIIVIPGGGNTVVVGLGSRPLTLTRLDPPCVFTLAPSSPTVSVNGGSGTIAVTGTGTDCSFTASVGGVGLAITNQSAASAPATISYTFMANPFAFPRSATIQVRNTSATITQNGAPAQLDVQFLTFGAVSSPGSGVIVSAPEEIRLTLDEQPSGAWSATTNLPWLVVTPTSGTGPATLRVSVDPALVPPPAMIDGPTIGFGRVTITAAFAPPTAVRVLPADLFLNRPERAQGPRGVFETPLHNAINVSGAVPVTGWATDDVGIRRVQIYRDPVPGEGLAEIYIGDAIRVKGARPDVAGGTPGGRSAGWGYMLLTNVLPGAGNGTFTLSAYADDLDGHRTLLGRRTFTVDNASAVRPFGTIDVPAQGETVSGTVASRGWVLTPQPKTIPLDGSTIKVYIDGVLLSPVSSYNNPRPDVKAFFPGFANSDGPEARLSIDTTLLADGVHTIAWGVIDDGGVAEGIGSRYFTVQNGMSSLVWDPVGAEARSAAPVNRLPLLKTDVWSREGVDETAWAMRVATDADGKRTLYASRGQRIELFLDPTLRAACGTYTGHLMTGEVAGPLPAGAALEAQRGIFRWQPAVAVSGAFEFVFVQRGCDTIERRIPLTVTIEDRK